MTTNELQAALTKFAQSDLRLARKEGEIMIAQTKVGSITLSYSASGKSYRATYVKGVDAVELFSDFKAKDAAEELAGVYQVSAG